MDIKAGGAAFPFFAEDSSERVVAQEGMTLRDWLAGQALSGYMVTNLAINVWQAAKFCYEVADAMIAERDRKSGDLAQTGPAGHIGPVGE